MVLISSAELDHEYQISFFVESFFSYISKYFLYLLSDFKKLILKTHIYLLIRLHTFEYLLIIGGSELNDTKNDTF